MQCERRINIQKKKKSFHDINELKLIKVKKKIKKWKKEKKKESNCLSSLEKEGSETGILGTGCGGTWFTWEPGRDPPDRRRSFMYWYIWEGDMPAGAYQNTNTIRDPKKWTDRLAPKDFFIIFVIFLFIRHSKRTSVWEAVGLKRWDTNNKCVQLFTHMSIRGDSS